MPTELLNPVALLMGEPLLARRSALTCFSLLLTLLMRLANPRLRLVLEVLLSPPLEVRLSGVAVLGLLLEESIWYGFRRSIDMVKAGRGA
jgi:hypothetical protein